MRPPGSSRLRVSWFESWCPQLDEALSAIPEPETCPNDLFRALASNDIGIPKRIALVSEGAFPVAVVGLRRYNGDWQPLVEVAVPYTVAPAQPGRLFEALAALDLHIRISGWDGPAPDDAGAREVEHFVTNRVSTRVDFDALWKELRNTDRIRKARNRCERLGELEFEVDGEGAATWIARNWGDKWSEDDGPDVIAVAKDVAIATPYLQRVGKYHTFRLLHRGEPVAGIGMYVHGAMLSSQSSYRNPEYDKYGVGVHLDELFFRWSATSRYESVDLGGFFEFKGKWAPPAGLNANFSVMPRRVAAARLARKAIRKVERRLPGRVMTGLAIPEIAEWANQLPQA